LLTFEYFKRRRAVNIKKMFLYGPFKYYVGILFRGKFEHAIILHVFLKIFYELRYVDIRGRGDGNNLRRVRQGQGRFQTCLSRLFRYNGGSSTGSGGASSVSTGFHLDRSV
jgi:hypothetical protein